jgi:sec-independent protein translocase protein TatB
MPSFSDSIFLFILALLLFGPKKLPVLARELGKWIGEFRRASNEFKMQMEEELRLTEQTDRLKKVTEMEAAAPGTPALAATTEPITPIAAVPEAAVETQPSAARADGVAPLPIASEGELSIMPPSTGLPIANKRPGGPVDRIAAAQIESPLGSLIESIPAVDAMPEATETAAHGS